MSMEKSFWLSWYSKDPLSTFEMHSPWWVSGTRMSDDAETVVAAVRAKNEVSAKDKVRRCYDHPPSSLEWRFCEEKPDDWSPFGSDRFPRADWMGGMSRKVAVARLREPLGEPPLTPRQANALGLRKLDGRYYVVNFRADL